MKETPEQDRPHKRQRKNRNIIQADFIKMRIVEKGVFQTKLTSHIHILTE